MLNDSDIDEQKRSPSTIIKDRFNKINEIELLVKTMNISCCSTEDRHQRYTYTKAFELAGLNDKFAFLDANGYIILSKMQVNNSIVRRTHDFSFKKRIEKMPGYKLFDDIISLHNSNIDETELAKKFNPNDLANAVEYILTAIALRKGQPQFRQALLDAYSFRCAVTNCDAVECLEAAHIIPYNGDNTNHIQNGLLLRADIHTLFDRKLLIIDHDFTVKLHSSISNGHYKELHNKKLKSLPIDLAKQPSKEALQQHRIEAFEMYHDENY